MTIRTVGLDSVHPWVEGIDAALELCRAAFGAEEAFRVRDRLVSVRPGDGETFALDGRPEHERSPHQVGLRLAERQGLDGAGDVVLLTGGPLLERGEHAPGVPYADIADPDGKVIEL